jgi:hypothetical protein
MGLARHATLGYAQASMVIGARRVFRLSLTIALSLALAYGLALDLPYFAPIFAFILCAAPKPPMGLKGLLGLTLVLVLTLGIGLLLIPVLMHYPFTGLLLVLLGLFFANYVAINLGKGPVGVLLAVGIAMIPAAGLLSFALATMLIVALVAGVALAVACYSVVYPFFPEDTDSAPPPDTPTPLQSSWLATRAALIVYPGFLLALINPTLYMPVVMKSLALGQQTSAIDARSAGRELIGSTLMAGLLSILLWLGLSIYPSLWMFFLWILLAAVYVSAKFYGVSPSRYPPTFWQNVMVTMLILLGPAVADSAVGKDVYAAFAVRISLFILVSIYAWLAVLLLDHLSERRRNKTLAVGALMERT